MIVVMPPSSAVAQHIKPNAYNNQQQHRPGAPRVLRLSFVVSRGDRRRRTSAGMMSGIHPIFYRGSRTQDSAISIPQS